MLTIVSADANTIWVPKFTIITWWKNYTRKSDTKVKITSFSYKSGIWVPHCHWTMLRSLRFVEVSFAIISMNSMITSYPMFDILVDKVDSIDSTCKTSISIKNMIGSILRRQCIQQTSYLVKNSRGCVLFLMYLTVNFCT